MGDFMSEIPAMYNGKPLIHSWTYKSSSGAALGQVARYQNGSDKKDIVPFFKRNGSVWKAGIELNSRLYMAWKDWRRTLRIRLFLLSKARKAQPPCKAWALWHLPA
jgi:hypothetical protein